MLRAVILVLSVSAVFYLSTARAQEWCVPPDPDYCVSRVCTAGEGDCDPGQCAAGLTCVNDVGARYGLPAHYDVCEMQAGGGPDPDYCVNNHCGIGDGDCDPGQCDEGVCVNDVGARYGLPAHYDVCEMQAGGGPDPNYCVNNHCGIGDGDCDPGQCDEGVCVNDVGARYGLPAHYDVCEAGRDTTPPPAASGVGQFVGTWRFTNSHTTQTYRFARVEACRGNTANQCLYDDSRGVAALGEGSVLEYSYLLAHQDGGICRAYFLHEPSGNTVTGHYGYGFGECLENATIDSLAEDVARKRYPTTGRRISQSAAALSLEREADAIREDSEKMKQVMEELLEVLTD